MAISAVMSWPASRPAAVMVAGRELGGVVVGNFGAVRLVASVVAAASGAAGELTADLPWPEHAAASRPAAKRATSRQPWQ